MSYFLSNLVGLLYGFSTLSGVAAGVSMAGSSFYSTKIALVEFKAGVALTDLLTVALADTLAVEFDLAGFAFDAFLVLLL